MLRETPYYARLIIILKKILNFSPEVWKDHPYSNKSDIWSSGYVIYEMNSLKPPFRAEVLEGLYKKIIKKMYPKISSHFNLNLCIKI